MTQSIRDDIALALSKISDSFVDGALAHFQLTRKDEKSLVSALAHQLYIEYRRDKNRDMRVQRERVSRRASAKYDLAITSEGRRVDALLEAKHMFAADLAAIKDGQSIHLVNALRDDAARLRRSGRGVSRFLVQFVVCNEQPIDSRYRGEITNPYFDLMRRSGVVDDITIDEGFNRLRRRIRARIEVAEGEIKAGRAFGTDIAIRYRLWEL